MESFIEDMRQNENEATNSFLTSLDPRANPKNIKMLYLYKEGADA
jgi:hypothetical protein